MAHTHNIPYAPNLPYYVSTRSAPIDGTQDTQALFELRDHNNCVVKAHPFDWIPVCRLQVPLTSLPCDHQTYIVSSKLPPTFHRFTLYSNGCLLLHVVAPDEVSAREFMPHVLDYARIVGTGMAGCLNLPFLEDLGIGRKQGLRIILAKDVSNFLSLERPGSFNVGKMFVERLLGPTAPFAKFTPAVNCTINTINYPSGSASPKVARVEVPSYELVQRVAEGRVNRLEGWGHWSLVSAEDPFSKAKNKEWDFAAANRWILTSNLGAEHLAPGESKFVRIGYPLFIVFEQPN